MADPNTRAGVLLGVLMKGFGYDSDYWKQKKPSGLLRASPNPHGYKTFLDIANPGITDYETFVEEDQARLTQRTQAVQSAEDHITALEAQVGGSGTKTDEILSSKQNLLPALHRKVTTAETRLKHSTNLLSQFQLIHRLLTSVQARIKPKVTALERNAIDRGLGMLDSEWAKLQTELLAANTCKEQDDAESLPAEAPKKKKKGSKKKEAAKSANTDLSDEQKLLVGRVFSDDGVLALNTEVVRGFSHDHRRDYWGWGLGTGV